MFHNLSNYPAEPGAKGKTSETLATSTDAAGTIASRAATLKDRIRDLYVVERFIGTPDAAADRLGIRPHSARPRCSELISEDVLEPTGERATNPDSGLSAAILRARK